MSAAKEQSIMLDDVVEIEETYLIGGGTRRNIGWVVGFPDARIRNYKGDGSKIRIMVTEGPDSELPITYTLKSRFPMRIDDFARQIARVPKKTTLAADVSDVTITRISRAMVTK